MISCSCAALVEQGEGGTLERLLLILMVTRTTRKPLGSSSAGLCASQRNFEP
jgi:hypothetical protein